MNNSINSGMNNSMDNIVTKSVTPVPARFVLFGDLLLCSSSVQELMDILKSSQSGLSHSDWSIMNQQFYTEPLEYHLFQSSINNKHKANNNNMDVYDNENKNIEKKKIVNGVKQMYTFCGTSINSSTVHVTRIPFHHIKQVRILLY